MVLFANLDEIGIVVGGINADKDVFRVQADLLDHIETAKKELDSAAF